MSSLRSTVSRLFGRMTAEGEDLPEADFVLAPRTADEAATVVDFASEHRLAVLPWGGGTHQGIGGRVDPAIILLTSGFARIVDWQPDDLTVVVEAGARLVDVEQTLGQRRQSVVAVEDSGAATIGGVVAAGASGWRRLRHGPIRERVLEVVLVTGDGRVVRAGARVVKNVTGYDIPRLVTGSFGSLGLVHSVCLKLWPVDPVAAMVTVDDPVAALRHLHRPLAVLEHDRVVTAYLSGPEAQVEAEARALDRDWRAGHAWPTPITSSVVVSVRVPPASVSDAVDRLPGPARYVAAHGVGEVVAGFERFDAESLVALRSWAEAMGGAVVVLDAPPEAYGIFDPWGTPPVSLAVQRRVKAAFDPMRVMVPGRLPGGL